MKRTSYTEFDRVRGEAGVFYPVPQAINPIDQREIRAFEERLNTEDTEDLKAYIEYRYIKSEQDIRFDTDIHDSNK
jgi:hypothetical protein